MCFYLGKEEDLPARVRNEDIVRHIVVLQPNASTRNHIGQIIQGVVFLKNQSSHRVVHQLRHLHPTLYPTLSNRNPLGRCLLDRERHCQVVCLRGKIIDIYVVMQ